MTKIDEMEPHERLSHARREAGFATASEAARAFGWNENTYRSHENGERGIKKSVASVYARAFKTTAGFIMFGHEGIFWRSAVLLTGFVGENGSVSIYSPADSKNSAQIAQLAIMFNDDVVGFVINETANLIIFQPGDLLITWAFEWNAKQAIGSYSVVCTDNDEWMLRCIRKGDAPDSLNLEFPFKPTITNAKLKTILPIHAIVPKGQWKQEDAPKRK